LRVDTDLVGTFYIQSSPQFRLRDEEPGNGFNRQNGTDILVGSLISLLNFRNEAVSVKEYASS